MCVWFLTQHQVRSNHQHNYHNKDELINGKITAGQGLVKIQKVKPKLRKYDTHQEILFDWSGRSEASEAYQGMILTEPGYEISGSEL